MNISVFQPPYPKASTEVYAKECLDWMETTLDELVPGEQDIVLLPEYATTPGLDERQSLRSFAETKGADFLKVVAAAAKRLQCLIALAAAIHCESCWFNRTLLFDRMGCLAFTYDKIHLTDSEREELGLTAGATLPVFQHAETRIGFATCFDLYFSEHFDALAVQRTEIVLCPSYQRSESAERIRLIAQTRALDSGTYLVRSSYSMKDNAFGGHSLVATPEGKLLADAGKEPGVIAVSLNPKQGFAKPASHGQPFVNHRRLIESHRKPGIYRNTVETLRQLEAFAYPHLCAHRGLSQACPENTLPAFAAAIAAGAHEIEFDVKMSCDGTLVICHDETVDRTTNGCGKIADLSWEQIRRLDAGSYLGDIWSDVRIPRLEEVLELVDGRIGLNVHVHTDAPDGRIIKCVCDLLRKRASLDLAYISLGTESSLRFIYEYAPDISRSCLANQNDSQKLIATAKQYACQRIQFFRQVTEDEIKQAHEVGLICNLFWSDDPEDAMAFIKIGIDVVLTNCTNKLVAGGIHGFTRDLFDNRASLDF